ncbi:PDZ and LIM domain protein 4 isoform X2 [Condylostylus longicornis]|uniref:PDZ and LIM domain protein 4 isoform X2 n=1 Tax=Condylostylus longicornis TaxID=2530218 RepID=UPI00244DEFF4|nr:PDZ and LIM domain protein 4 isoform X2 [Condylostylus longicornis]
MSPKLHEFVVILQRDGNVPWGIRLVGGSDLDTPLIITKVQCGSPAFGEVLRGDIISKIGEYDARDLRHEDAQMLFKTAGNSIRLVVHRDNKIAYTQAMSNDSSRCSSTIPPASPDHNFLNPKNQNPHRAPSPFLPGPGHYEHALTAPVNTLPYTEFPNLNESGGYVPPIRPDSQQSGFSPMPTRDHLQDVKEEQAAIVSQPYRTTPLVLPGAKVKKDPPTTESYLRYYPNPAVRAAPGHDYHDVLMKQRVADTMLHKVVGEDAHSGRVFHKQFNSPIGLYSDSNIESTIRQTVPSSNRNSTKRSPLNRPLPSKLEGHKKTVVFDPSKSETFRALQEEGYGVGIQNDYVQEANPVQPKVFHPTAANRMVPGKKPISPRPATHSPSLYVNNPTDEQIRQSNSFNRLMYSVLGHTDY